MFSASAISFVISVVPVPLTIQFCKKYSLYDSVNARKIHSGNMPRLGGVGIIIAFFAGCIIYTLVMKRLPFLRILPLLVSSLLICGCGRRDDLLDLPAYLKFAAQL